MKKRFRKLTQLADLEQATREAVTEPVAPKGEVVSRSTGFRDRYGATICEGDTVSVQFPRGEPRIGVVVAFNELFWVCWGPRQQTIMYEDLAENYLSVISGKEQDK